MDERELTPNPFTLVQRWYDEAMAQNPESHAMALATVDADGAPDVRMVLMRGLEHGPAFPGREAVVFFTNYESQKGLALQADPRCAALFYWGRLDGYGDEAAARFGARQVRITGRAEKVESALSDAYFSGRPRLSQLGAWASPQSRPIPGREVLEQRLAEHDARFAGQNVARPPHWGGFRIVAERVELWIAQAGRLHDRFEYRRGDGWTVTRLAP